jgi:hypothetical protein
MGLNLRDANLGDRVNLYFDKDGYCSLTTTSFTLWGTLIGQATMIQSILIGWKGNEKSSTRASSRARTVRSSAFVYVDNIDDYVASIEIHPNRAVADIVSGNATCTPTLVPSGMVNNPQCTKCGRNYPDGEHDPSKGKFVCFECKLWARYL